MYSFWRKDRLYFSIRYHYVVISTILGIQVDLHIFKTKSRAASFKTTERIFIRFSLTYRVIHAKGLRPINVFKFCVN